MTITATTSLTATIRSLADMIHRAGHTAPTSEDLHDWAHDIDWYDYTISDYERAAVPSAIIAACDLTGESAETIVSEVEHYLGW